MVNSHRTQLAALTDEIVACRMCTRLVDWREKIGEQKRASYRDWDYWAKPVPSFGDPDASLVLLGLAPAAHGGNRTGRVFTGDASATFLTSAMHQAGLANQPNSDHRDDGLVLCGAYIGAAVRCVPPGDRPTPEEQKACLPYLVRELKILPNLKVIMALGHIAFRATLQTLSDMAGAKLRGKFRHGEVYRFGSSLPIMVASYHPSPRNTNTGVLSMEALVKVLNQAKELSQN
ncbi:MAG: uracil-DNA glycosylase [SAR202 cluster bacterium]|nr:uracil-DNA glycosylase [SAR202 cluster bacterium]